MIIFGDFNLHYPMWGSDHNSRSSADAAALIDLTVCSSSMSGYRNSYVLECSFESDHSPIITELSLLNSNKRIFKKDFSCLVFFLRDHSLCCSISPLTFQSINQQFCSINNQSNINKFCAHDDHVFPAQIWFGSLISCNVTANEDTAFLIIIRN
ncbi:hypothetical protein TNCV_3414771 [Trichonephila clavipes]|uniref:Endonuclease/exonuclease/phosphatase domain-containing protein n=1 Tax=Trichonephila clavipes TaxID=2585209 RepID=A0A8X6RK55_TRICX|nr:hypothetical protein TNCV_3414771 [Trichonephila clavipes]